MNNGEDCVYMREAPLAYIDPWQQSVIVTKMIQDAEDHANHVNPKGDGDGGL